jgi:hypothetical protein
VGCPVPAQAEKRRHPAAPQSPLRTRAISWETPVPNSVPHLLPSGSSTRAAFASVGSTGGASCRHYMLGIANRRKWISASVAGQQSFFPRAERRRAIGAQNLPNLV